jgi:uncharacterized membrane protein
MCFLNFWNIFKILDLVLLWKKCMKNPPSSPKDSFRWTTQMNVFQTWCPNDEKVFLKQRKVFLKRLKVFLKRRKVFLKRLKVFLKRLKVLLKRQKVFLKRRKCFSQTTKKQNIPFFLFIHLFLVFLHFFFVTF